MQIFGMYFVVFILYVFIINNLIEYQIVNDTRFSMTDSNNFDTQPIGYGQAFIHGCPLNGHHHNSITNCYFSNPEQNPYHPNTNLVQSMFSINLQKTGLIIDDDIDQWIIDDGNNDLLEKNVQISPVSVY